MAYIGYMGGIYRLYGWYMGGIYRYMGGIRAAYMACNLVSTPNMQGIP